MRKMSARRWRPLSSRGWHQWMWTVNGKPELLLPQKNFVARVVLEKGMETPGSPTSRAGCFRERSNSTAHGAIRASLVDDRVELQRSCRAPSIFLLDAEHKQLTLCERDATGVWGRHATWSCRFQVSTACRQFALGTSNTTTLHFWVKITVAWLSLTGEVWEFETLDGYDTP